MPAVEVADGAVQGRIQVAKIDQVGAELSRLRSVQFVGTLRPADIIDRLRPSIGRLEVEAFLEAVRQRELGGVIDSKADVAVHTGALPAGEAERGDAQRLVVHRIRGDVVGDAITVLQRNGARRASQGREERDIDAQTAQIVGAYVVCFHGPAFADLPLYAQVPLLVVGRFCVRRYG